MNYFFTADTHFNHDNIIKFCNRPFKNAEEMNETMIQNWNAVVGEKDTVYHLGDFGFFGSKRALTLAEIVVQLKGNIIVIPGSHDKGVANLDRSALNRVTSQRPSHSLFLIASPLLTAMFQTGQTALQAIVMCHYAMRVWPLSHYGSWQIHGHSHGHLKPQGKQWDVGVDNNQFTPVSLDRLKAIMWAQPNSFDLVD